VRFYVKFAEPHRINPSGKMTKVLSTFISPKMTERSETKMREAKLPVKISFISMFDANLRFALFSLRSAIFTEISVAKRLVALPARVTLLGKMIKKNAH
jgi:hypothetical protein